MMNPAEYEDTEYDQIKAEQDHADAAAEAAYDQWRLDQDNDSSQIMAENAYENARAEAAYETWINNRNVDILTDLDDANPPF